MPLSRIQSESVNLSDNFAFTGTVTGAGFTPKVAVVSDQKSNAALGGGFTNNGWRTRDLNTKDDPDSIVTLSSNQITLGVGTYNVYFTAPAFKVQTHHTRFYNVTDSVTEGYGSNAVQNANAEDCNHSMGFALFTIASGTKTYELQHICSTTKASNGMGIAQAGIAGNVGLPETFAIVNIIQVG
tara:strand:+ start:147 stop:698 length:552 start_codon:yes stop_codon:yes gene_type:complete